MAKAKHLYFISLVFTGEFVRSVTKKKNFQNLQEFMYLMCNQEETLPVTTDYDVISDTGRFLWLSNDPIQALFRFCLALESIFEHNVLYLVDIDRAKHSTTSIYTKDNAPIFKIEGISYLFCEILETGDTSRDRFTPDLFEIVRKQDQGLD